MYEEGYKEESVTVGGWREGAFVRPAGLVAWPRLAPGTSGSPVPGHI